jgi:hypothetical protein
MKPLSVELFVQVAHPDDRAEKVFGTEIGAYLDASDRSIQLWP